MKNGCGSFGRTALMVLKAASVIEGRATLPIIPIAADIVDICGEKCGESTSKEFASVKTNAKEVVKS